jgi:hypothetical protein
VPHLQKERVRAPMARGEEGEKMNEIEITYGGKTAIRKTVWKVTDEQ